MKKLITKLLLAFTLIASTTLSASASDGFIYQNDSDINTAVSMYVGEDYLSGSIYVPTGVTTPFNISRLRNIYRETFDVTHDDFSALIILYADDNVVNITYQSKDFLYRGFDSFKYDESAYYTFKYMAWVE